MVIGNISILIATLVAFALNADAQQPVTKVGVISIKGAIVGTKDGQKASRELEKKVAPKQKEFESRQAEIAQLQDQFNRGSSVMADDKRNQVARDTEEKKKRLERDIQDSEEDVGNEQQKMLQSLGQRVMAVIEKYAKDNGYTLVLDVSNPNTPVLFASSSFDITQDIITLYDQTSANGGPAPNVPPAPKTSTQGPGSTKPPGTTQ
jgi:outer membrane protein